MPGFEAIYRQTVTLFNRKIENGVMYWHPNVLRGVHLIVDKSIVIATYGEHATDNAKLHVRYFNSEEGEMIRTDYGDKKYMPPKQFKSEGDADTNITFAFGDEFDFIIEGEYDNLGVVNDSGYKNGFFNYMNKTYDNVFAITNVSKFHLIPHFEILAR